MSSTAIREAIAAGDLALAQRYLGRPRPGRWARSCTAMAAAEASGFPTANVLPQPGALPPNGVYAVEVMLDGSNRAGVANLGARPTFAGGDAQARHLEVHLLDFAGDLYGKELEVAFRQFLRRAAIRRPHGPARADRARRRRGPRRGVGLTINPGPREAGCRCRPGMLPGDLPHPPVASAGPGPRPERRHSPTRTGRHPAEVLPMGVFHGHFRMDWWSTGR